MSRLKLVYLGRLVKDLPPTSETTNPRMWDVFRKGWPYHGSSMTLEGMRQLGIVH